MLALSLGLLCALRSPLLVGGMLDGSLDAAAMLDSLDDGGGGSSAGRNSTASYTPQQLGMLSDRVGDPVCQPGGANTPICSMHGICRGHVCYCQGGWFGPLCNIRTCPRHCNGHGACLGAAAEEGAPEYSCNCTAGWGGPFCGVPACPMGCSGNGECGADVLEPLEKPAVCFCDQGWKGAGCDVKVCPQGPNYMECSGRGECKRREMGGEQQAKCKCHPAFKGGACERSACFQGCSGHGTCVGHDQCMCEPTYLGRGCETKACPSMCHGNGECLRSGDCDCDYLWTGKSCNVLKCPGDCNAELSRGRCGAEGCECADGWEGVDCGDEAGDAKTHAEVMEADLGRRTPCSTRCAEQCAMICHARGKRLFMKKSVRVFRAAVTVPDIAAKPEVVECVSRCKENCMLECAQDVLDLAYQPTPSVGTVDPALDLPPPAKHTSMSAEQTQQAVAGKEALRFSGGSSPQRHAQIHHKPLAA